MIEFLAVFMLAIVGHSRLWLRCGRNILCSSLGIGEMVEVWPSPCCSLGILCDGRNLAVSFVAIVRRLV